MQFKGLQACSMREAVIRDPAGTFGGRFQQHDPMADPDSAPAQPCSTLHATPAFSTLANINTTTTQDSRTLPLPPQRRSHRRHSRNEKRRLMLNPSDEFP